MFIIIRRLFRFRHIYRSSIAIYLSTLFDLGIPRRRLHSAVSFDWRDKQTHATMVLIAFRVSSSQHTLMPVSCVGFGFSIRLLLTEFVVQGKQTEFS